MINQVFISYSANPNIWSFIHNLQRFHCCLTCFKMLYSTAVFWCAMLRFLAHPKEVFGYKPNSRRGCQNNREELGFALVGHDFKSVHADNFARCYFKCSLEERCQSVTFLWSKKECQMKKETRDFVENPAATYSIWKTTSEVCPFSCFSFVKKNRVGYLG